MATNEFGKEAWVELFRELGLSEEQMLRWHSLFEGKWPDDHQRFLAWLGIGEAEIKSIRQKSRGE